MISFGGSSVPIIFMALLVYRFVVPNKRQQGDTVQQTVSNGNGQMMAIAEKRNKIIKRNSTKVITNTVIRL